MLTGIALSAIVVGNFSHGRPKVEFLEVVIGLVC